MPPLIKVSTDIKLGVDEDDDDDPPPPAPYLGCDIFFQPVITRLVSQNAARPGTALMPGT